MLDLQDGGQSKDAARQRAQQEVPTTYLPIFGYDCIMLYNVF